MEIMRQVRTEKGVIVLQWSKKSSLLDWYGQMYFHTIKLKNLIKFRGILREYCRYMQQMARDTGRKAYVDSASIGNRSRITIVAHMDSVDASIRFMRGDTITQHGLLTLKEVKNTLTRLGHIIVRLSKEHGTRRWEDSWMGDEMNGNF